MAGTTSTLAVGSPIIFRGKEINLVQEGDYQVIKVTQKSFISEMDTGKVDKGRLQDDQLNSAKRKEFSSVNDGWQSNRADKRADKPLQPWPGNHTRTHAGALQHHRLRESTPESGLVFYAVPMDRSTTLVAYSDSSWANARQSKSQMGEDRFWIGRADGDGPRVTRSTLASEANALDEAIDRLTYSNNHFLTELLYDQDTARSKPMLKQAAGRLARVDEALLQDAESSLPELRRGRRRENHEAELMEAIACGDIWALREAMALPCHNQDLLGQAQAALALAEARQGLAQAMHEARDARDAPALQGALKAAERAGVEADLLHMANERLHALARDIHDADDRPRRPSLGPAERMANMLSRSSENDLAFSMSQHKEKMPLGPGGKSEKKSTPFRPSLMGQTLIDGGTLMLWKSGSGTGPAPAPPTPPAPPAASSTERPTSAARPSSAARRLERPTSAAARPASRPRSAKPVW
ncbi:unnamed protein product [Effrenium voratum]|nr:unnamed protein product [Effrenium voratum]